MRIHTLQENSAEFRTCVKRCARCAFGRARRSLIVRPYTFQSVNTLSVSIVPMSEGKVSQVIPTAPVPVVYWGRHPVAVTCPHCGQHVTTRNQYTPGAATWLGALVLVLAGFLLCSCVPCCVDACKDAEHVCPNWQYLDPHQQDSAAVMMGHWVRLSCNH